MKHIRNFPRLLFLISIVFLPLVSFSQAASNGYEIRFKPQCVCDKYLYLVGIYGDKTWMVDSAKNVKNQFLFKNKKQDLPAGFYTIQTKTGDVLVNFIIDQVRKFTIKETKIEFLIENSDENIIFQRYMWDVLEGNDLHFYYETAPESLLGRFVFAQYFASIYDVDFKDTRLLRTPLNISKVLEYFLADFDVEFIIERIETLFNWMLDKNPTPAQVDVRDFYLKKLIHLYMNLNPKCDPVFAYLVDNYAAKMTTSEFISDFDVTVFKRIADRKRRTFVGQIIPAFESYTKEHEKISTADITTDYTVLWFWDPDCNHCLEETPDFFDFYCKYHDVYHFEVIAVSVTEDYDRWVKFITDHRFDWINTSYAIAEPNYDAMDFFDFAETPAIYVIDKQHKIVARQPSIDELMEFFESLPREK